jgi:hypothetical protein
MRTFTPPAETRFYAGADLHARTLFLVILDRDGKVVSHATCPPIPTPSSAPSPPSATGCGSS